MSLMSVVEASMKAHSLILRHTVFLSLICHYLNSFPLPNTKIVSLVLKNRICDGDFLCGFVEELFTAICKPE